MRKQFVDYLFDEMAKNPKIVLLTGDLGFGVLDKIRDTYPNNFKNVGSSEQLMIGIAVGLSYEGYIPICYSITPFVLYRPFEMIRNYLDYEKTSVKLVGTGRDKDYLDLGITHWAEDDFKILSCFDNIVTLKPEVLTADLVHEFLYNEKPTYLNLKRN
jgi:transketolase